MTEVSYENMGQRLAEILPELAQNYGEALKDFGPDVGQHVIYGQVLNPYLRTLLKERRDTDRVRAVFEFLEQLAAHEDWRVQNVVSVTVLESFVCEEEVVKVAKEFMGPNLLRLLGELTEHLNNIRRYHERGKSGKLRTLTRRLLRRPS
jgi:hypothetical protein